MNKRTVSIWITLAAIYFSLSFANTVFASKVTQNVFRLEDNSDIIVTAKWDNEQPEIKLVSPNGKVFNMNELNSGEEKSTVLEIKDARKGQWGVEYEMKDNEVIDLRHEVIRKRGETEEDGSVGEDTQVIKNKVLGIGLTAIGTITSFIVLSGSIYLYNKSK